MKTGLLYDLFRESKGISTDSRSVKEGQIFFALWGENYNGNNFAADAIKKGAAYAVIDDPLLESDRTILVEDCLFELQALASQYRKELAIPVLAITGTNGKTTTKELLSVILAKKFRVHFTRGNLNNQIGVPMTILSAPADTQLMIVEMGANHTGEIRTLCLIARPDYGIITNIGTAHIEGFGSFEGVVRAKSELYEYLGKTNGIAFYNDKDPLLAGKIYKLINRAVPFCDPTGSELKVEQVASGLYLKAEASYRHRSYEINTKLFGSYNLDNIRAAIATGLFFGVEMKDIVDAVGNYVPSNNRSQVRLTGQNTLICDSYNANPVSLNEALNSFAGINAGNKAVILGDMLELGAKSQEEHARIVDLIQSLGFDRVMLVGGNFEKVSASSGFDLYPDVNALALHLKGEPLSGMIILVKGSRGMGLEKIYDLL